MSEIAFIDPAEPAFLGGMRGLCARLLSSLWLAMATTAAVAAGAPTNSAPRLQSARWLLIVDTSAGMERRARAMEGVLDELLSSGMNGQMQTGDELGIWTYNKELFAGVAPMQMWDPARSSIISGRSSRFVARQKFEDQARFEKVVPELDRLVKGSRRLTVLVLSDASQKISGTPYDAAINAAYAERRPDLAKTRMPLITVLRAERGQYIGYNVSFAPWPIEFPRFQPEPESTNAVPASKPLKSIIIGGGPKEADPETNSISISTTTNTVTALPIAEVKPVPLIPVKPEPSVEPVVATPLPGPSSTGPAKPLELAKVVSPEAGPSEIASPVVVEPPAERAPAAAATVPISAGERIQLGAFSKQKLMLIVGIACIWVAIAIALILARRSRRSNAASLITRSIDRSQH